MKKGEGVKQKNTHTHTGSGRSNTCLSVVGKVNNMGIIIYSFNSNISPKMSYGVLECDIVILKNYMLMIL